MVSRSVRQGKQRGDWKLVPDELRLKEGALVMILANRRVYADDEDERGTMVYANGDLGELVGKSGAAWLVKLQRTGTVVSVVLVRRENTIPLEVGRRKQMKEQGLSVEERITERGKGKSEIIGTITYMPLRAAYGCTVHKTQGLSLTSVQVNIRDPFFRQPGMLFVALSRCTTAEGLRIVGDQAGFVERCKIEPRVQKWL
jgi:ATP-dependent exoDNAse (exonuclease V) alpha subunit